MISINGRLFSRKAKKGKRKASAMPRGITIPVISLRMRESADVSGKESRYLPPIKIGNAKHSAKTIHARNGPVTSPGFFEMTHYLDCLYSPVPHLIFAMNGL